MHVTRRIATVYKHIQTTPAATWVIEHNLHDYPIVDVFIVDEQSSDINNPQYNRILPSAVNYTSDVICTVTFSSARAGYATVV